MYIGIVVNLSWRYAFFGFALVILQMGLRYGLVGVLSGQLGFTREEKVLSQVVYASGLPAFVMSQLPIIFDPNHEFFKNPQLFPNLCMPIVLGTILYSGLVGPKLAENALVTEQTT